MKAEKLGSPSYRKMAGMFAGVSTVYMGGIILGLRDRLPEPYDVPDHMGNVLGGFAVGTLTAMIGAANAWNESAKGLPDIRDEPSQFRKAVAITSTAIGVIVNGVIETKVGAWVNAPDTIDFYYGVVASGIFGAFAPGPYHKGYLETYSPGSKR